ncbi:tetratricopeptide repeat protein [Streptomyces sp. NPDC056600]|uniref:tetratricopeptide repeat protein n=1 Tax=Streptomyces sp. NPDC056600 TaxID=3345874 RepID=UPI0036C98222
MLLDLAQALVELGETDEARACLRRLLALGDTADRDDLTIAQDILGSLPTA